MCKTREHKYDIRKSIQLVQAAIEGNTDVIDGLIAGGANVNLTKENGYPFLMARPWKAICDYVYSYKKIGIV